MRQALRRFLALPRLQRWGIVALLLLLLGFLGWFFYLRAGGGTGPAAPQPPQRPALGKVVSFPDYRRAIGAAQSDLRDARSATGDDRQKAIQRVKSDLEAVEGASVLPVGMNSKPSQIDNTALLRELGRDEPNLVGAEAALAMLGNVLDAEPPEALQGILLGGPALASLDRVLADPVFDYNRSETPLQRFARWLAGMTGESDPSDTLWRWFLSIVAGLAATALTYLATDRIRNRAARLGVSVLAGFAAGMLFYYMTEALDITLKLLGALGLVVAAVAVGLIMAGLNRASSPAAVRPLSELAQVLGMSASESRGRAEEAAAQEDYRSAIRYRCLAVLLALDEAGMLTFDRTATNREYLFRAPGTIHDDLQPLLDRFDQVWYGNAQANSEEWPAYTARAASIEARLAAEVRATSKARAA